MVFSSNIFLLYFFTYISNCLFYCSQVIQKHNIIVFLHYILCIRSTRIYNTIYTLNGGEFLHRKMD